MDRPASPAVSAAQAREPSHAASAKVSGTAPAVNIDRISPYVGSDDHVHFWDDFVADVSAGGLDLRKENIDARY